jgi:RES domain
VTSAPTLGESPPSLAGFPTVAPPKVLVRVCRTGRAAWWFSSDGSGRFDLAPPDGTCYLATDAYAAIREASRLGPVSTGWVAARELRHVTPPDRDARLAATTRQAAGRFGVTTELATILPYDLPRRWAAAFRAHGLDGIRHQLRHDQRARPSGVALFGPAGTADVPKGISEPLDRAHMRRAGVDVLEPPSSAALTIVP